MVVIANKFVHRYTHAAETFTELMCLEYFPDMIFVSLTKISFITSWYFKSLQNKKLFGHACLFLSEKLCALKVQRASALEFQDLIFGRNILMQYIFFTFDVHFYASDKIGLMPIAYILALIFINSFFFKLLNIDPMQLNKTKLSVEMLMCPFYGQDS